ncbi:MAG: RluA family pseudouridine synthase, partial [Lentisphaerae bacterium]|nr:RluA family pseudouridine synthase [Lentisphaerota bacterium]
ITLQDFIAKRLGLSKRAAKQHIDGKVVRVNGKNIWIARHILKFDDLVTVSGQVPSPTAISQRIKKVKIIFEDENYLVVDKPRGILVNESDYSLETVVRTQTGIHSLQASHRLDRDTTGCLLMSKSQEAHEAVIEIFKQHKVAKTYRTVVHGRWDAKSTTIDLPIEGRRAVSNVRCLKSNQDCSHLVIRIETGRTHQIRRHLSMARHPVMGDLEYGPKIIRDERIHRLTFPLLHAVELELEHPVTGEPLRVFSPVPQDFHKWLTALKLQPARQK